MSSDKLYFQRCLDLAKLGGVNTFPNPMVGAVIVHNGVIIGEGFHLKAGESHAEVMAINAVKDRSLLAKSCIYVSLEPCSHHGKTPPCANRIVDEGIPEVKIGCLDPNPLVAGSGNSFLKENGVQVIMAPDPSPFQELNTVFFTNQIKKRPFVVLKWAESSDGFIAGLDNAGYPTRTSISGQISNYRVHKLRAQTQAIIVGKNTARIDDPLLNSRNYPGPDPIRILVDPVLDIPDSAAIFSPTGRLIVLNSLKEGVEGNVSFVRMNESGHWSADYILEKLFLDHGICSVLVEGGKELLETFIESGSWDELIRIKSNQRIDKGVSSPVFIGRNYSLKQEMVEDDLWETFTSKQPK